MKEGIKFKKGDRVVCIKGFGKDIKEGAEYTVIEVSSSLGVELSNYKDAHEYRYWDNKRFKYVKVKDTKLARKLYKFEEVEEGWIRILDEI